MQRSWQRVWFGTRMSQVQVLSSRDNRLALLQVFFFCQKYAAGCKRHNFLVATVARWCKNYCFTHSFFCDSRSFFVCISCFGQNSKKQNSKCSLFVLCLFFARNATFNAAVFYLLRPSEDKSVFCNYKQVFCGFYCVQP